MPATRTDPLSLDSAIRAISALEDLFSNHSLQDQELALDAFLQGRAAFWTKNGYSNQTAGLVFDHANKHGLPSALAKFADDAHSLYLRHTPYLLGTLIPLNKQAVAALNQAWFDYDEAQSATRRARAEHPVPMFEDAPGIGIA